MLSLNGVWKMKKTADAEWITAMVPGSVFHDLLNAGKIPDPFYRDNEELALNNAAYDYEYQREFEIDSAMIACERIVLCCEGLDTLAEISINDTPVAATGNMHRLYEYDIKELLRNGLNKIHITFFSPLPYIAQKQTEQPTWGVPESVAGYQHLRKAHYMFG